MKPQSQEKPAKLKFDALVEKNVEAVTRIEQASQDHRTSADVVADAIAGFCGSSMFLYVHFAWFGGWLLWNALAAQMRFDPPPYNLLTLVVSLEAIFLSTFILISQNRQQRIADQRNHLDLQINLLAEQESSQMLTMLKEIMARLDIPMEDHGEVDALEQATDPERVAEHIQDNVDSEGRKGSG